MSEPIRDPKESGVTGQQENLRGGSSGVQIFRRIGKVFQIVAMVCILALFALVIIKYSPLSPSQVPVGENHPAVGKQLNRLALVPLTGTDVAPDLDALLGRVTLINFWGTWCLPCREEFPHLAKLVEEFRHDPLFQFFSVSCGSEENLDELRQETTRFLEQSSPPVAFPTYADPEFVTRQEVDRVAGFEGYPTTLLVDQDRTIRAVWVGYWPGLEKEIKRSLSKLLSGARSTGDDSAPQQ